MKRATFGALAWLTVLAGAPAAHGQALPDEVTGVLEVTEHEATLDGRIRLIHIPPQTRVNLDPVFEEMADQIRFLDGQRVTATGELRGDVLWRAEVRTAEADDAPPPITGQGPELTEMTGVLQVSGSAATLDGGVRLIRVPPQTGVSLGPLLAQTAAEVAPLAGSKVRATGQLEGNILWSAILEPLDEEAAEEVPEELEAEADQGGEEPPPEGEEEVPEGPEEVPPETTEPVEPGA